MIRGRIRDTPEDFRVDELPLYAPCGAGSHLYLTFEKRDLTTDFAVRQIGSALGVRHHDIGVAGMKDRRAVTTQTISIPVPQGSGAEPTGAFLARASGLAIEGVRILGAALHGNKLKTGHLAGNRFDVVVRGIAESDVPLALERLARIKEEGVPNAFGEQRFGARGDNVERALAWIRGEADAPRDPKARRFQWSAVQSGIFNEVLKRRVEAGTWAIPLVGDLLKKESSGGLFHCTDATIDLPRVRGGEVSPTGPMVGVKMPWPEGEVGDLERAVLTERLGADFDLGKMRALGEGTRRPLRLVVRDLTAAPEPLDSAASGERAIRARFVLPSGAYATTVLGAVFDLAYRPSETSDDPD